MCAKFLIPVKCLWVLLLNCFVISTEVMFSPLSVCLFVYLLLVCLLLACLVYWLVGWLVGWLDEWLVA